MLIKTKNSDTNSVHTDRK